MPFRAHLGRPLPTNTGPLRHHAQSKGRPAEVWALNPQIAVFSIASYGPLSRIMQWNRYFVCAAAEDANRMTFPFIGLSLSGMMWRMQFGDFL